MESIRWRYQPEFRINVTIEGQPVRDGLTILPSFQSLGYMQDYGAIAQMRNGVLLFSIKQRHNGVTWVPAIPITTPFPFGFALQFTAESGVSSLDFYGQGTTTFGRRILYLNNLSPAGVIDANIVGNTVRLTPAADVALSDFGSISSGIPSLDFTPGSFTQFRAGKIIAGAVVTFTTNQTIAPTDHHASVDMSSAQTGSYLLRLEGGSPIQERVVIDKRLAGRKVHGYVEIFRDVWQAPLLPRNYTLNFTAV
jgi:hypothetical protein